MKDKVSRISVFAWTGVIGFLMAVLLGFVLAAAVQLDFFTQVRITVVVLVSFFLLAFATKIILGAEDYVLYRYFIFCGAAVALVPWLTARPVLPYLDVYVTAFGLFHFFGRIGCFFAGCCHGRPANIGVAYSAEYLTKGLPSYFIGVKLFPVQLVEAIGVLAISCICFSSMMSETYFPGNICFMYLVSYASLRYILEFMRGDTGRSAVGPLSQAQWTSAALLLSVVLLHTVGLAEVPRVLWIPVMVILLSVFPAFFILRNASHQVVSADHTEELGNILQRSGRASLAPAGKPIVFYTSLGIRIAISKSNYPALCHCSLSYDGERGDAIVGKTFRLMHRLKFARHGYSHVKGQNGVHHFIINDQKAS
jgi:prolipoprotein diacylglyceryltransferase